MMAHLSAVSPANCQLLIEQVLCGCNGIIIQQRPNSSTSLWGIYQKSVAPYDMFHYSLLFVGTLSSNYKHTLCLLPFMSLVVNKKVTRVFNTILLVLFVY